MPSLPTSPALHHIRTVLVIALAGLILWVLGVFLMLVFTGILLAVALHAPAALLARHLPFNYGVSLLIVIVAAIGLASSVGLMVAPDIASQVDEMRARLPELADLGRSELREYQWGRDLLDGNAQAVDIASSQRLWRGLAGAFSTTFSAVANVALIVFIGLYLAVDPGLYQRGVAFLAPDTQRERVRHLLEICGGVLRYWIFGILLSMLTIGVLTWVGLTLLGVPLALSLALIAGLLAFIPNIGPVLSAVPAVLMSLLESPQMALYVALLYIGVQAVESYLVTPFIQKRTVSLPPALTVAAQFLLGMQAGALGLFVATPLAAVGLTLVQRLRSPDEAPDYPPAPRAATGAATPV